MSAAVVDAHVHLWRLADRPHPWIDPVSMAVIHRDFTTADLLAATAAGGVGAVVLVQVLNRTDETESYLRTAERTPLIGAVVGWADLSAADLGDRLDGLAALPGGHLLTGIRHQALAEPDPAAWVGLPDVQRGMAELGRRGLVCDLMVRTEHLAATERAARALPGTRFVLDHAGKPPVASGWGSAESARWAEAVRALARHEHVVAKLSGLTTVADLDRWRPSDLRPYVDLLLDAFGPARLVLGSDWPVSLRAGDYPRTLAATRTLLDGLSAPERAAVLADNAHALYRLP